MAAAGALGVAGATGHPWLGAAGAAGCFLAAWRLQPDPDVERWLRGSRGEVATARLLAGLPGRFVVLHDRRVPGSRANIDHLVIGPTGVWVVDTKAYRAAIRVRQGVVWVGGHEVAVASAAWEAERVAAVLNVSQVHAAVAIHGPGLRRRGASVDGVRVLRAGRLCHWLRRGTRVLSRSDVAFLAATADQALPPAENRRTFL